MWYNKYAARKGINTFGLENTISDLIYNQYRNYYKNYPHEFDVDSKGEISAKYIARLIDYIESISINIETLIENTFNLTKPIIVKFINNGPKGRAILNNPGAFFLYLNIHLLKNLYYLRGTIAHELSHILEHNFNYKQYNFGQNYNISYRDLQQNNYMLIEYFNKPTEILSHVHSIFHQLHLPSNIKNMTYIEFIEFLNQSNTFKQMYPMLTSENKKQIIYMLYNKFFNNEESS